MTLLSLFMRPNSLGALKENSPIGKVVEIRQKRSIRNPFLAMKEEALHIIIISYVNSHFHHLLYLP